MYAHLNALILADYLGADVVLPPSVYRESFAKYFSMDLTKNEVKWTPADTGALLDVAALREHYAKKGACAFCGGPRFCVAVVFFCSRARVRAVGSLKPRARLLLSTSAPTHPHHHHRQKNPAPRRTPGMRILDTPPLASFPDCMHPQDAYPAYRQPEVRPEQIVQLPDTYLQSMHVWYLWDRAAERVAAKHAELLDAGWPANATVVLDLPCPFLGIMTLKCMDAAQEAATALKVCWLLCARARFALFACARACARVCVCVERKGVLGPHAKPTHKKPTQNPRKKNTPLFPSPTSSSTARSCRWRARSSTACATSPAARATPARTCGLRRTPSTGRASWAACRSRA